MVTNLMGKGWVTMNDYELSYELLSKVYKEGAYSNLELNKGIESATNKAQVTRTVYGVLSKDVELSYYISKMCSMIPQKPAQILLKLAMYCIQYMDSMPDYAVVNNTVNLCQTIGKMQLKGFINGTLKAFCREKPALPTEEKENLSIKASVPLWLVEEYCKQYGIEKTKEFILADDYELEHIRPNTRQLSLEGLQKMLTENAQEWTASQVGGLFVRNNPYISKLFVMGLITFQSVTSMLAVKELDIQEGDNLLDLCSAPGGKAVLMSETAPNVNVVACDIHRHRTDLIGAYCRRMKANNIEIKCLDGTVIKDAFIKQFDRVICDAPCSGLGVAAKKPDIYLYTDMEKILSLTKLQLQLLTNASKYVKDGGRLVYSTCTTLQQENGEVVKKFLAKNSGWKLEKSTQYYPDGKGLDGFFIACLTNKK